MCLLRLREPVETPREQEAQESQRLRQDEGTAGTGVGRCEGTQTPGRPEKGQRRQVAA